MKQDRKRANEAARKCIEAKWLNMTNEERKKRNWNGKRGRD